MRITIIVLAFMLILSTASAAPSEEYYDIYEEYCDSSFSDDSIKSSMISILKDNIDKDPSDFWSMVYLSELVGFGEEAREYSGKAMDLYPEDPVACVPYFWYETAALWTCANMAIPGGLLDRQWYDFADNCAQGFFFAADRLRDYIASFPNDFSEFSYEEIFAYRIYLNGLIFILDTDLSYYDIEFSNEDYLLMVEDLVEACSGSGDQPRSPELLKRVYSEAASLFRELGENEKANEYTQLANDLHVEPGTDASIRYLTQSFWIWRLFYD